MVLKSSNIHLSSETFYFTPAGPESQSVNFKRSAGMHKATEHA